MANLGNFEEGNVILNKALRNALEIEDTLILAPIELTSGILFSTKGDWELATVHLQKCIEYSEAVNFLWISGIARTCLGRAYAMMGDPEAGKNHVKNGLEIHRNTGVAMHLPYSCYVSSFTHLELDDLESARSLAEEALRLSQDGDERNAEGQSMILLGKILGISVPSKLDEAKECILKGIQILKAMGARPSYSLGYLFLGEINLNAGKADTARENLMTAEGMFQEMVMDYWLTRTREILAKL